ncbi:MAG: hypothetical protein K2X39_06400 [Silvanigrellaceae bacterium]|nr:hypothetical protein [Silvanigrellaceae bacterium]
MKQIFSTSHFVNKKKYFYITIFLYAIINTGCSSLKSAHINKIKQMPFEQIPPQSKFKGERDLFPKQMAPHTPNPHPQAQFGGESTQPLNYNGGIGLVHIKGNSWRTSLHPALVFGVMSKIISERYVISGIDRKNLNLKTDWDNFFISGRLLRNKININIFFINKRQTEIIIKNVVEYYSGDPFKTDANSWLPSPDITDEVAKLVDSTNRHVAQIYQQHLSNSY